MNFDLPLLLTAILLLCGGILFGWATLLRRKTGLPIGRVVYSDTGSRRELTNPLYSRDLRLAGKPDYLVELPDGTLVPMEVKSGRPPDQPHEGHLMQLIAYCALVEDEYDERPPYGLLRYSDRTFAVDYTAELEDRLIELLALMRHDLGEGHVSRHHDNPAKCAACGVSHACIESLAPSNFQSGSGAEIA